MWFTWSVNQGGRAHIGHVDWFGITNSSGNYSVTAYFQGGTNATLVTSLPSREDALAYIDNIITESVLEGS